MIEIINLLGWTDHEEDDGTYGVIATFVTSAELPEPRVRAHEVMRRMIAEDRFQTMSIEEVDINPTDQELGLKPKLADVAQIDFVRSAFLEIQEMGEMRIPLWVNMPWLVHELRANYEVGINYSGRKIVLVHPDDERRPSPDVTTAEFVDQVLTETP